MTSTVPENGTNGSTTNTVPPNKQRDSCILDSVLDVIGDTPLIRLQRIGQELPCELLVKC